MACAHTCLVLHSQNLGCILCLQQSSGVVQNIQVLDVQWGAAYKLSGTPADQQETLKYLEWREKQYDLRYRSDVFGKETNGQPLVSGAHQW